MQPNEIGRSALKQFQDLRPPVSQLYVELDAKVQLSQAYTRLTTIPISQKYKNK